MTPTASLTSKMGKPYKMRDFAVAPMAFDADTGAATIDEQGLLKFTAMGAVCHHLDGMDRGELIDVNFNLRGRRIRRPDGQEDIITSINVTSVRKSAQAPAQGDPWNHTTPDPWPRT